MFFLYLALISYILQHPEYIIFCYASFEKGMLEYAGTYIIISCTCTGHNRVQLKKKCLFFANCGFYKW